MIVKIVNEELTALMGGENTKLTISPSPHGGDAGRPQRRRQDHQRRQAGGLYEEAGQAALLVACDTFRPPPSPS